jgi:hypothetical protein
MGYGGSIVNKRIIIKSIFDSLSQSLIFACLGVLGIYDLLSLNEYMMIGVLGAILSSSIYIVLALQETENKNFVCFTLIGIPMFALFTVLLLAIRITFKFDFLPSPEVNNANGIIILFTQGCYIITSFILRTCCFVILIIKNIRKARQMK